MRAFCLKSPGDIGFVDVKYPTVTPWGAILKPIAVTPCSSDIHTIWGGSPKMPNLVLGHEGVGEIIEVGEFVRDFKIGDVVAIPAITPDWREVDIQNGNFNHAGEHFSGHKLGKSIPGEFAEAFLIPDADTTLAHIPSGVSLKQALMSVDVVTTGLTGAEEAEIKLGDTIVVMGIGPIGLMAIAGAKILGASRIIAIGSRPKCVELAKFYGATDIISYKDTDVVKSVLDMTSQKGADKVIIAGGNDDVFTQAFDMVCYGTGVVSNINYFGGTGNLGFPKFSGGRGMAGKTLHTSLCKGGRARLERILQLIKYNRIDPEPLITHELDGFDKIKDAIYLMKEKPADLIKVMVRTNF